MAEPAFVDHEVEVVLNVTTTAEDIQAALVRSGIVTGALIGEAMVERVQVAEFPEGDPAVVLPPDPLAGSQAGSNGPSGSPASPSGRATPEPQDCWCGEAKAGLCPTPERCGERAVAAQEYARKLLDDRRARSAALSVEPWHGRRVYDFETGSYLGRAEGEPYSDGIEGVIRLRQDEDGQTIKPYALCAFVKLDNPPEVSRG